MGARGGVHRKQAASPINTNRENARTPTQKFEPKTFLLVTYTSFLWM